MTFPGLAIRAIFLAFATLVGAGSAVACDAGSPCNVPDGFYFVRAPAGWDGKSRLPVAVFFHGYRSSAADTMANEELGETLSKAGILLVAPDGVGGSWSVADRLSRGRDNIAYTRAVLADVRRRFPIDERRLVATGFSAGGFMVWQIACAAGNLFAAYAPFSGAFLDPIPDHCPMGPISLLHVHGTADAMVPMVGRWIAGGRVKQSDVHQSIAKLLEIDNCPARAARSERRGELNCDIWPTGACAGGREIQLCLHGGGHEFDPHWVVDAVKWAGNLPETSH